MTVSTRAVRRVILLLAAPWLSAGAQSTTFESRLDPYVTQAVRDWRVPGLAIAVVRNDSVIMARGYGTREIGTSQQVDARTRFAIGSTTKAMTAAALGILVDEGKLRWDDKVVTHLPSFRLSDSLVTRELTVRDLLTHRAGLPNADLLWTGGDYNTEEILRRIGSLPLAYSLRSGFIYQNIMYAAAGEVVAAVSGMPWEEFVRVRLFEPLGMRDTEPTLARLAAQANVAAPHDVIDDSVRVVPNRPVDPVAAAGSVWSSVNDMTRWIRFMLDSGRIDGRALLAPATHRELLTPQVIAPPRMYATTSVFEPRFFTYGLGWFLHDYRGASVAMHTGSIDGMSAIVGLLPDHRAGVVVLANLDHAELRHALMLRVFDMVLEDARSAAPSSRDWSAELLALYGQQHEQARAAEERQLRSRELGTSPSLPLEQYVGTYGNPTFGDVTVTLRDGALHLAFGNARRGTLEHWQHDTFRARWEQMRARPSLVTFAPADSAGFSLRAFGVVFRRRGAATATAASDAAPRNYREPLGALPRRGRAATPTS